MATMCGRFAADLDWGTLGLEFEAQVSPGLPQPSWNFRPTQSIALVAQDAHGVRHLAPAQWSLIPAWSSTDKLGYPTFNARIETILGKRTWEQSARAARALIPMTGYYETSADGHPWYFFPKRRDPLLVAGLYSWWHGRLTCTILTRDALGAPAQVHGRMPVLVDHGMAADWIAPETSGDDIIPEITQRSAVLSEHLRQHEVRPIRGDGPRLIETFAPSPQATARHHGITAGGTEDGDVTLF